MPRTCPLPCLQANQQTLPSAKPAGTAAPKHQQCQQLRRTPAGTLHSTAALPLHPFPPCSPPAARSPPPPAPAPFAASSFSFSASPPRRPAPPRLHARSAAQAGGAGLRAGWQQGACTGRMALQQAYLPPPAGVWSIVSFPCCRSACRPPGTSRHLSPQRRNQHLLFTLCPRPCANSHPPPPHRPL